MPRKSSSSSSSNSSLSSEKPAPKIAVVVSELTVNVSEEHLSQIFRHFGVVDRIEMMKGTGMGPSTAKLYFDKKQDAERAINYMNQGFIDGAKIKVEHENLPKTQQQSGRNKDPLKQNRKKDNDKQRRTEYRERRRSRSRGQNKGRRDSRSRGKHRQARHKKRSESRSSSSSKSDSSSNSSSS